jgi:hypothetical protein
MFDYDWFHGAALDQQEAEAKRRCAVQHFPDFSPEEFAHRSDVSEFLQELEVRRLIYLRDGFSYELKSIAKVASKTHLTFECEPVDEQYKVGAFVVAVPFEEITRVEIFAVHPDEKPEDMPAITGFRSKPEPPGREYVTERTPGTTDRAD